jgi:hypothetical protein
MNCIWYNKIIATLLIVDNPKWLPILGILGGCNFWMSSLISRATLLYCVISPKFAYAECDQVFSLNIHPVQHRWQTKHKFMHVWIKISYFQASVSYICQYITSSTVHAARGYDANKCFFDRSVWSPDGYTHHKSLRGTSCR